MVLVGLYSLCSITFDKVGSGGEEPQESKGSTFENKKLLPAGIAREKLKAQNKTNKLMGPRFGSIKIVHSLILLFLTQQWKRNVLKKLQHQGAHSEQEKIIVQDCCLNSSKNLMAGRKKIWLQFPNNIKPKIFPTTFRTGKALQDGTSVSAAFLD